MNFKTDIDLSSLSRDEYLHLINALINMYYVDYGEELILSTSGISLSNLNNKILNLENAINSAIFDLKHNPRDNFLQRDKYIISKLEKVLEWRV